MAHLTDDQLTVLKALMVSDPPGEDRTEPGLSHRTGLPNAGRLLRELDDDSIPRSSGATWTRRWAPAWWPTEAAGELLEQLNEA